MISTILLIVAFMIIMHWLFYEKHPFVEAWMIIGLMLIVYYQTGVDDFHDLFSICLVTIIWSYNAAVKSFENEMKRIDNR